MNYQKNSFHRKSSYDGPSARDLNSKLKSLSFSSNEDKKRLLSEFAENYAKAFENITTTQIRKFYNDIVRIEKGVRQKGFEIEQPLILMMPSKAAYAAGRNKSMKDFKEFISILTDINKVKGKEDFEFAKTFFEAIVGFHKLHGKTN